MAEERRANPNPFDIAGALAGLYTIGYLLMVGMLFVVPIPGANEKPLLQLFGLMSAIQMALINFYFGSSKNAEAIQRSTEQRSARAESKLQEVIVKAVPTAAGSGSGNGAPSVIVERRSGKQRRQERKAFEGTDRRIGAERRVTTIGATPS